MSPFALIGQGLTFFEFLSFENLSPSTKIVFSLREIVVVLQSDFYNQLAMLIQFD